MRVMSVDWVRQIGSSEWSLTGCLVIKVFSFLLHSLLDNGAKMTLKRRSVFSLIFIDNDLFILVKLKWFPYKVLRFFLNVQ